MQECYCHIITLTNDHKESILLFQSWPFFNIKKLNVIKYSKHRVDFSMLYIPFAVKNDVVHKHEYFV
jgi:hypothetical protein